MKDRFDLEQDIMNCWNAVDDIKLITEHFVDSTEYRHMPPDICDAIMNKYLGLAELYEIKFKKLWDTFEELIPTMDGSDRDPVVDLVTDQGDSDVVSVNMSDSYTQDYTTGFNSWDNATYTVNGNIGDTSAITFTLSDTDHDYNEVK